MKWEKKKRFGHVTSVGRPRFQPNEQQRSFVKSLAVLGMQQEQICQAMGTRSEKTLRKHFLAELQERSVHAMATVARTAFEMATSGKYPAMTLVPLFPHAR